MSSFIIRGLILWGSALLAMRAAADEDPGRPKVVYIDPTAHLPEGMGQLVDEPLESVSLQDLAARIHESYGVRVRLRESDLEEVGISADDETTLPAGLPLYEALDLALEDVSGEMLVWILNHDIVQITTADAAWDIFEVRMYEAAGFEGRGWDQQTLANFFQNFADGEWIEIEGVGGEIDPAGGVLVVRQSQSIHRQIAALLDAMLQDGDIIRVEHPPHHRPLFDALDAIVDVDAEAMPLPEFIAQLAEQTGVPFRLLTHDLAAAGVPAEAEVSYHLGARSLREVLRHSLQDVDGSELTYLIDKGAICITSNYAAFDHFELVLYDVRDLLSVTTFDRVLRLVSDHTSGPWYDSGGVICDYGVLPNEKLIVRAPQSVHEEIASLLAMVRERLIVPAAVPEQDTDKIEVRHYFVSQAMADQLQQLLPEVVAPDSWSGEGDAAAWIRQVRIDPDWGKLLRNPQAGFFQMPTDVSLRLSPNAIAYQAFGVAPQPRDGGGFSGSQPDVDVVQSMPREVVVMIRQSVAAHEQIEDLIVELIDPEGSPSRSDWTYWIGPPPYQSRRQPPPLVIRSDVLSDPGWTPADRPNLFATGEVPQQAVAYVDVAAFLPDVMRQPSVIPMEDVPLLGLVQFIEAEFGIQVLVDEEASAGVGITPDALVSLPSGAPLFMALDLALQDVDGEQFVWLFDSGVLTITTADQELDRHITRTYDVGELLGEGDDGEWLVEYLEYLNEGEWKTLFGVGGDASCIGNVLIVTQTETVQRNVAALIDALRLNARIVRASDPVEHARLYELLDTPIAFECEDVPISMVMEDLSARTGAPIHLHESDLAAIGIAPDEFVTYLEGERPLRQVFDIMLEDVAGEWLTYLVKDGAIQITTLDSTFGEHFVCIYQVSDILNAMPPFEGRPDYEALIDLLQNQTSGEWEDIDGIGGEVEPLPGGRIAVATTQAVHAEIAAIFDGLRTRLPSAPAEPFDADVVETRYYSMPTVLAEDVQRELPRLIAPLSWRSDERPDAVGVMRTAERIFERRMFGDFGGQPGGGGAGFFEVEDEPADMPETEEAPPEPEPQPPTPYAWLVITQTAGVHQQIAALYGEWYSAVPASTPIDKASLGWPISRNVEGELSEVIDAPVP